MTDRETMRAARFAAYGDVRVIETVSGRCRLESATRGTIEVSGAALREMLSGRLARMDREGRLRLTGAGRDALREAAGGAQRSPKAGDGGQAAARAHAPAANPNESPLAQLRRLKTRDGAAFLADREFEAGERLRWDYERAMLMPRIGANWDAAGGSGGRRGGPGFAVELTDGAIAARQRVDRAIDAAGPEIGGLLVDVCCFLKGLERVEFERGWPVRSAKVVLRSGLGLLARHYWPERPSAAGRRPVLHWGTGDYRPRIGGGANCATP